MYEKYEKICSRIMFVLMCISLGILMYYGRYNHPTGDDYYYGGATLKVYTETGSLIRTVAEACRGAAYQYMHWQGTYSAMVLMYLPPNIFGEWAYKLVTTVLLTLYAASLFYFSKPLLCGWLKASKNAWVCISSVFVMLTIQTVDFAGESFFWYNGSMYYTGFFSITLVFLGVVSRYFYDAKKYRIPIMLLLAVFLGGGNYVSLLPAIILSVTITIVSFFVCPKQSKYIGMVTLILVAGLMISAVAPGNMMREAQLWDRAAWKAIAKSILQGFRYIKAWLGIWWILAAIIIMPIVWNAYNNCNFKFRYPLIVSGYLFGIFCSMSCPTFYAENSTGPARAVAIVYYGFMIFTFMSYIYVMGAFYLWLKSNGRTVGLNQMRNVVIGIFVLLMVVQCLNGKILDCSASKALREIISGRAAEYERQYQERLNVLYDSEIQDVVFTPYSVRPEMIYVGDFTGEPYTVNNLKVARYFGKNSICVDYSQLNENN